MPLSDKSEPERVFSQGGTQWVPRTEYTQMKLERDAWREEADLLASALRRWAPKDDASLLAYEAFCAGTSREQS